MNEIITAANKAYRDYMDWANQEDPWRRDASSSYYESQAITKAVMVAVAKQRAASLLEQADVLAEYTGDGTHRQWVSTGAWLMPGERVVHVGVDNEENNK